MEIKMNIVTKNPCYKKKQYITVRGLMLHSVGCAQPRASVFDNSFNSENLNACVHAFIDALDGTIHQHLPWDMRGWHAGGGANNTHIGVEMCESEYIIYDSKWNVHVLDYERARKQCKTAYDSAVELFASLCSQYKLNPYNDIISHAEGYKLGVASNHGDPEQYWKGVGLGYTMDGFRKDVALKMGKHEVVDTEAPFIARVLIDDLYIRNVPNGVTRGFTGKGSFTITEVSGNWGKLKSGAGWIYIGNPKWVTIIKK